MIVEKFYKEKSYQNNFKMYFDYSELIHIRKELNSALAEVKALQEKLETQATTVTKEKSELQVNLFFR